MTGRIPRRIISVCLIVTMSAAGCSQQGTRKGQQKTAASVQKDFQKHMEEVFRENVSDNGIELHYTLKDPEAYGIEENSPFLFLLYLYSITPNTIPAIAIIDVNTAIKILGILNSCSTSCGILVVSTGAATATASTSFGCLTTRI